MLEDLDPAETREWLEALDSVLAYEGADRAFFLLDEVVVPPGFVMGHGLGVRGRVASTAWRALPGWVAFGDAAGRVFRAVRGCRCRLARTVDRFRAGCRRWLAPEVFLLVQLIR